VAGAAVVAAENKTVVDPLRVVIMRVVVLLGVTEVDCPGMTGCVRTWTNRVDRIRAFRVPAERHCH